jgi:hypothetical protein
LIDSGLGNVATPVPWDPNAGIKDDNAYTYGDVKYNNNNDYNGGSNNNNNNNKW